MQDHRRLKVWRRAHHAALEVEAITRRFPKRGYGWLASQLRRSAESIPANIVEGCGQATGPEFARYLQSAIASAGETDHHIEHGAGVGVIPRVEATRAQDELRQIQRMLVALRARVRSDFKSWRDRATDD